MTGKSFKQIVLMAVEWLLTRFNSAVYQQQYWTP